jgi:flavodoxin I
MAIGLFYGTDTGNTEAVAKKIVANIEEKLGAESIEMMEIYQKNTADMAKYDLLILGMPTWYDGELQGDWEEFIPKMELIDFSNKKVAFFGLGDQYGYASYFCDALGVFASIVEDRKGTLCGLTSTEGYEHDFSKAERDGQFVGLCLDVDNQDDQTEDRLNKWIPQVLAEFGL